MHPYCAYVSKIKVKDDVDKIYHDNHYGVPIKDDDELFGRLVMEINQAGLSWRTILIKEKGFRKAYDNFNLKKVANYKEKDIERLLDDTSIIRNRLKIHSAIFNAQQILLIQAEHGSLRKWLDKRSKVLGENKGLWVKEFKKHFKFVGGEIVGEFLMSIDMLSGSHGEECAKYKKLKKRT